MHSTILEPCPTRPERFSSLVGILLSVDGTNSNTNQIEPQPPRASLLGLPPELRVLIYKHLADSLHLHAKREYSPRTGGWNSAKWRLCTAPDATFRQLCTKPEFSGLYSKEELCHHQPIPPNEPFALRATCRLVNEETRGVFDKSELGVTIEANAASQVLNRLKYDTRISLKRLTIVDTAQLTNFRPIHGAVDYFRLNAKAFPSLRILAVQTTQSHYNFWVKQRRKAPLFAPKQTWQDLWFVKALHDIFEARVSIVLEAWVVSRAGYRENQSAMDEMVIIRGVRWGEKERLRNGDDHFEMVRKRVVVDAEDAQWKTWWKSDWMGYGRRLS